MTNDDKLHIIHIDMDAFYASVEEVDNPKLKGHPLIVGGSSPRGIVTTCNYEARKFGVHSAMPIFMAKKLCPQAYFVPGRMYRYKEMSNKVFSILYSFTDLIEPVSIDEAYLDIKDLNINPLDFAKILKSKVYKETGLSLSMGISYNKFLAKIASDWNKPDGLKIISKDMVPDILLPLKVRSVHGIGRKSAERLNNIGIFTVEDLLSLSEDFLVEYFGKMGHEIYDRIRGIDRREINTQRERKSLGTETTFRDHTKDRKILLSYLRDFSKEIGQSLEEKQIQGRTLTVKIKDEDFRLRTKSRTLDHSIYLSQDIFEIASLLLDDLDLPKKLRLIGLTISNLSDLNMEQLSFLD